ASHAGLHRAQDHIPERKSVNITRNARRWGSIAAIAIAGSVVLSSCAANEGNASDSASDSTLSGTLVGGGASSQGSAQEAWVAAFQTANPDVTVEYDPTGSGTGRDNFIAGANAFTGSDRAYKTEELGDNNITGCLPGTPSEKIPSSCSPIPIIFIQVSVDTLHLVAPSIAKIFKGEITSCSGETIVSQNPDASLSDQTITAVH